MKAFLSLLLGWLCLAYVAGAAPNSFCVFDNGLHGTNLASLEAQLDLVKEIGFDGLTWRTDSPARIQQLFEGAKRRGLKVCAIYANLDLKDGKLVYDPRLNEIIPLCRGTDTLLWPNLTSRQFLNSDPAGDDIAVAGLRELSSRCASNDVRIALYPHANLWVHRVEDALRLVKKVDRPNVGLTFNLCHALFDGAEDRVPALLEAVAPHLFIVSLNGADSHPAERGWPQLIQPLGQGSYEVAIVLNKLRAIGFQGPVTLQCYNLKGDPRTHLAASMLAWKKFNAGR
jgi:sugar phosphate isomerase/epimerase